MQINNPYVDLTSAQTVSGNKNFTGSTTMTGTLIQSTISMEVLNAIPRTTSVTVNGSPNQMANAAAGNIVLTLPVATTANGARMMFTKSDPSANTVTIVPQSGGTIGGAANYVLTTQFQSVTLLNINAIVAGAWVIVGKT